MPWKSQGKTREKVLRASHEVLKREAKPSVRVRGDSGEEGGSLELAGVRGREDAKECKVAPLPEI